MSNKQKKLDPLFVEKLGIFFYKAPCKECTLLKARRKEAIKANPTGWFHTSEYPVRCKEHSRRVKRRYGSLRTRRRHKELREAYRANI